MKKRLEDFAVFGGTPEFLVPIHVAQINLPPWGEVEKTFREIFARKYFTNNGPLVQQLDLQFADFIGARHAVSVTNGTVALMILARALELSGEVIVPAFTFPATLQAVQWAGLMPVLSDVDRDTQMLTPEIVEPMITERTAAILGVHVWGRPCDPTRLESFAARKGLLLFFDACHGIGCSYNNRRLGTFGAGEAFSFHATKIVNGGEGGCITTDDDRLAARLRILRSFHSSSANTRGKVRINGKMSEAQAGMALLSLDQYGENFAANRRRFDRYRSGLKDLPAIRLIEPEQPGATNNFQYVVIEVDEVQAGLSRDAIMEILSAENVICRRHFWPGLHRAFPRLLANRPASSFESTEWLADHVLQLPTSQSMDGDDVDCVCELLKDILQSADGLRRNRP